MRKYYTRPCNFYYGNYAKHLVKTKKALPLAGNKHISFDQLEIFERKKGKKTKSHLYSVNEIKKLNKEIKNIVERDLQNITCKRKIIYRFKFNIPLIIQGENPGLTLGTSLTGVGTDSNAMKANELHTLSSGWEEYAEVEGVEEKDLYLFHYDRKKLEEKGCKAIWLNYFLKEWSNHNNAVFSKQHGLKWRPDDFDPNSIGTYLPYFQLDGDLTQVNQLLKYIKFGFGQCMDHVCYDIREGRITREKAIELVKLYDGKCSDEYIENFCNFIEISNDEFWKTVEKFRGDVWEKTSDGNWRNRIWDLF